MLVRQCVYRIPSSTSHRTCCRLRNYSQIPPSGPPFPSQSDPTSETDTVPSTWPTTLPTKSDSRKSASKLIDLLPHVTVKVPPHFPQGIDEIPIQTLTGEPGFRSEQSMATTSPRPSTPTQSSQFMSVNINEHNYHIHINTSTKNCHVTITNHKHDPVVALSAGRLGLKHSRRATQEAGAETTAAALKMLQAKYPNVFQLGEVELVLKGYGKARQGAIATIMGPMGDKIRGRINRVTDATNLAIGNVKASNPKRN